MSGEQQNVSAADFAPVKRAKRYVCISCGVNFEGFVGMKTMGAGLGRCPEHHKPKKPEGS